MITDTSQIQKNLDAQKDRITTFLTKQAGDQSFGQNAADVGQSFLSALSANTGAAGFQNAYGNIQNQRNQAQGNLYNLMQDEVNKGNEDASAVDKAIKDIAGNDTNAYEKIANEIHNSPDMANKANANLLANRAAAKIGYQSTPYKVEQLQLQKLADEATTARMNRQIMQKIGFTSPKAFEKYQEKIAEDQAAKHIALPQVEAKTNEALGLINEVINHPGMSSMVGSRLGLGSVNTLLPDWLGGKNPIAGTNAANFKAKFDELQGKQFLEAYGMLRGGGSITEIEGEKATKAMSDMSLAQSEKEFSKSANVLKKVLENGLKRARGEQVYEDGGMSSIPSDFANTDINALMAEKARRANR